MEAQMGENGKTGTTLTDGTQNGNGNGKPLVTPQDIERSYGKEAYRNVEILRDGTLREHGDPRDEQVTRTLKTQRTWY
jgi:hypothetical protein